MAIATYKPELFNIDSVMSFYESADGSYFKVFAGTYIKVENCRYIFEEDDKEIGSQKLMEALICLESNKDNTNPYVIQVYKKGRKLKDGSYLQSAPTQIVFQLNKPERYQPYYAPPQQQQADPALRELLGKIVEGQNLLISKMSASEVEEDYEEEKPKGLAGLLDHPQFQEMAIDSISMFMNKFLTGSPQPQALAGIPEDQQVKANQAIAILSTRDDHYGDHLLYLANVDADKYNMLLSFIK